MNNEQEQRWEERIRFVARHYREGALNTDRVWQQFAEKQQIQRTVPFRRYWIAAASVLLLLIGWGSFQLMERNSSDWIVISTAIGERKDVFLPDSTLVAMAGNSCLRYDAKAYGKERRTVEMQGKSYFQVTRNESQPFSVRTTATQVTVLGTSFQVSEQVNATEVYVLTGKVRFDAINEETETEAVILTAGMTASYAEKRMNMREESSLNRLAWHTRQLRFQDTPLEQVIRDLNDYYQVTIRNQSNKHNLKLTATFENLSLDEVLSVINQTLDIRLTVTPTQ